MKIVDKYGLIIETKENDSDTLELWISNDYDDDMCGNLEADDCLALGLKLINFAKSRGVTIPNIPFPTREE